MRRKQQAISPVLATVILIAITLIAAVAIAGFVFGLFGSFTKTAQVSLGAATCTDLTKPVCTLSWTNNGNANTQALASCSITWDGATEPGAITGAPVALASGSSGTLVCTATTAGAALAAGQLVSGYVSLGNGGSALFSGSG